MITVAELQEKYQLGERNFEKIKLQKVALKGVNLSQINLSGSDLTGCDLTEACLDGANLDQTDLSEAIIDRASLVKASLNQATLVKSSLIKTKLVQASLIKANLQKANLNQAYLTISSLKGASLHQASLHQALLNRTYLNEADLTDAVLTGANLDNARLDKALYNKNTIFDSNFDPVTAGMQKILIEGDITTELLVKTFNALYQLSQHYLGNQMTNKYWQSSCPDNQWLKNFTVDGSGRIAFAEADTKLISKEHLKSYYHWLNSFVINCSQIIQNFPELVAEKKIIEEDLNLFFENL